nr:hypothetical protein [Escherichia albertii]
MWKFIDSMGRERSLSLYGSLCITARKFTAGNNGYSGNLCIFVIIKGITNEINLEINIGGNLFVANMPGMGHCMRKLRWCAD